MAFLPLVGRERTLCAGVDGPEKFWCTCRRPSASMSGKPGGPCSLPDLTSPSLTDPTTCHTSLHQTLNWRRRRRQFCLLSDMGERLIREAQTQSINYPACGPALTTAYSQGQHRVGLCGIAWTACFLGNTTKLLTQNVFRLHAIPQDIVLDRDPQFTSQVWKEICSELGAQVSFSSGFHPQTNGQSEAGSRPAMCCHL